MPRIPCPGFVSLPFKASFLNNVIARAQVSNLCNNLLPALGPVVIIAGKAMPRDMPICPIYIIWIDLDTIDVNVVAFWVANQQVLYFSQQFSVWNDLFHEFANNCSSLAQDKMQARSCTDHVVRKQYATIGDGQNNGLLRNILIETLGDRPE